MLLSGNIVLILLVLSLTIGLSLSFGHAEAASMTFTGDTTITSNQTIAAGETWRVNSGGIAGLKVTLGPHVTVVNNGLIINNGSIYLSSTATLENNGILANDNMGYGSDSECDWRIMRCLFSIENHGLLINNGTFNTLGYASNNGDLFNNGTITNNNLKTFTLGYTENYDTISNAGTLNLAGRFDNNGGIIINNGTMNELGDINDFGTIVIDFGATFYIYGASNIFMGNTIINHGTITSTAGSFSAGPISNDGTINIPGEIRLDIVANNGVFNFLPGSQVLFDGQVNNVGTFNNEGTITAASHSNFVNDGSIINKCGATFTSTGVFSGNPVNNETCIYEFDIFERGVPSDGLINLHQPVTARAHTNDVNVNQVDFLFVLPGCGASYCKVGENVVPLSSSGQAEASYIPREGGHWIAYAVTNTKTLSETFEVPISVIPESPIGSIALVLSSVAAVTVFATFRRKMKNDKVN